MKKYINSTTLWAILSAVLNNVAWYFAIKWCGAWLVVAAAILAVVCVVVTWNYIPGEIYHYAYTPEIKRGFLVSAIATAVSQVIIAVYVNHQIAALMTLLWSCWYGISLMTMYIANKTETQKTND